MTRFQIQDGEPALVCWAGTELLCVTYCESMGRVSVQPVGETEVTVKKRRVVKPGDVVTREDVLASEALEEQG